MLTYNRLISLVSDIEKDISQGRNDTAVKKIWYIAGSLQEMTLSVTKILVALQENPDATSSFKVLIESLATQYIADTDGVFALKISRYGEKKRPKLAKVIIDSCPAEVTRATLEMVDLWIPLMRDVFEEVTSSASSADTLDSLNNRAINVSLVAAKEAYEAETRALEQTKAYFPGAASGLLDELYGERKKNYYLPFLFEELSKEEPSIQTLLESPLMYLSQDQKDPHLAVYYTMVGQLNGLPENYVTLCQNAAAYASTPRKYPGVYEQILEFVEDDKFSEL